VPSAVPPVAGFVDAVLPVADRGLVKETRSPLSNRKRDAQV
jgi:hypothetical protein